MDALEKWEDVVEHLRQESNEYDLEMPSAVELYDHALQMEKYKKFFMDLVDHYAFHMDMDGGDFESMAEKNDLIRWEEYDPEGKHQGLDLPCNPGDKIWVAKD